jgi:lipopolysaccharide/colanic/teichoic acid biosynthesis glycosyltransferase
MNTNFFTQFVQIRPIRLKNNRKQLESRTEIVTQQIPETIELQAFHSHGRHWLLLSRRFTLLTWSMQALFNAHVKRLSDILICLVVIPLAAPLMMVTGIIIRLDSPGKVLFKQQRIGKWGKPFACYKFRSMYEDAEARKAELLALNEADEVVFKMKNDPRVTRVGRIIRKLSIDELPQVFNVLKGEMSFVGPRPPVPHEVEQYEFDQFRRLGAVPGITGLQQVSGRSTLSFKRWVELDVEYIDTQNLRKDIQILVKTIPTVISRKGAY